MINHITVFKSNKGNLTTHVYYENMKRTFTEKDNQPKSVVLFKLNSRNVETLVTETGTVTYFR